MGSEDIEMNDTTWFLPSRNSQFIAGDSIQTSDEY
jgi:hypothetical protein